MISISDIMFRVYRNPLLRNVRKVDIVDHTKSVLKLLRIPATYQEKSAILVIDGYRVATPPDLYILKSVTSTDELGRIGTRLKVSSDSRIQQIGAHDKKSTVPLPIPTSPTPIPGVITQENDWQKVVMKTMSKPNTVTYKHVPGWIYFDFEAGMVEIIYSAFMVDDNGFPLIPDNESLLLAIENYVKVQYFIILFETGHLSEKALERAETQYAWYIGQASNFFSTPTEDEAETIFDSICRLVPDRDAFFTNFKYNSNTERLKLHM